MGARRTNRRQKAKVQPRFTMPQVNWLALLNSVLLGGVLLGTYQGTVWLMDQPIEAVNVQGSFQRVPSVRVEAALAPFMDEGFLSVSLNAIRQELEAVPWVASAAVRRKWPGALEVTVTEERAAARWGKSGLLNTQGKLFVERATHLPVELPRLDGPAGSEQRVAQRYFDLQQRLEQRGVSAIALTLNERGAWNLRLTNGIEVRFGSVAVDERISRLFLALDQVIAPISERVDYVDMRYTNGFAIGWKKANSRNASLELETGPHG
jgi:cell division protein FtsQ